MVILSMLLASWSWSATRAPLGASYGAWKGGFADPGPRLDQLQAERLRAVTLIPNYALMGLDRIEFSNAATVLELGGAISESLRRGLIVAVKPHLEPGIYSPGFDKLASENHSWRADCPWRGFFDLDPMSKDYREGVVGAALNAIALGLAAAPAGAKVRLDIGSELMRSEVEFPERWLELLADARARVEALGLAGRVLLSHNFAHHLEIPEDMVLRMEPRRRKALGRYIAGLDAVSISQYMDLTAAMPAVERGKRLPTSDEVARALVVHETAFVSDVLVAALGVPKAAVPPLWIGEFGVGRGGLRHPNVWAGQVEGAEKDRLYAEIARGMEGLVKYLDLGEGRLSQGAILWVTGPRYDVFGWGSPEHAVAPAAEALRKGLQ
ncbi:MAG: hypothetical protein HY553_08210 [Elusimicrobia bacterium]|nr:hypothetical protein [Elusimicrobiota bacterium]